jgi:hypothetical protein
MVWSGLRCAALRCAALRWSALLCADLVWSGLAGGTYVVMYTQYVQDYTPYEGMALDGGLSMTVLRGKIVYRSEGDVVDCVQGQGEWIPTVRSS